MNERIRELAKQAYEDVIKNTPSFLVTKEIYEEKFAELIVEKCMNVTRGAITGLDAFNNIKEHFGVEE